MTRDEVVALIALRLGNRTDQDTNIVNELKYVQTKMEEMSELPWFMLSAWESIPTIASQDYVDLPSDFLLEWEQGTLQLLDPDSGEYIPLTKDEYQFLHNKYRDEDAAQPKAYALVGATYALFPTPDIVYTMRHRFFEADTVLSTNVENDWLKYAPDVFLNRAGMTMAQNLRDKDALSAFTAEYGDALKRMWDKDEARKSAGIEYVMGGVDA